jgi:4-amino-4-deoxy-L-arabinose transferase-like glycosyltransferase
MAGQHDDAQYPDQKGKRMRGGSENGVADLRSQSQANISPAPAKSLRPIAVVTLLVILLAGLGLRLYRLTWQGVWDNEAFSLTVSHLPFHEMTAKIVKDIVHPPLHYYLLHGVFRAFGLGDFQARLVSVVFGMVTVGVIFLLGQYLFDTSTGLLASLLMAVSQLGIMYSQEARPYAMAVCLSACAIYCYCRAWRERRWLAWCGFIAFAILMLYTQYFTGLLVAGMFVYNIFQRKQFRIPALWWLVAGVAVVIAFAPWLTSGIIDSALRSQKTSLKSQPPWFAVDRYTYIRDLNVFNNGDVDTLTNFNYRRKFLLAGLLLFSVPALLALRPLVSRRTAPAGGFPEGKSLALLAILWLAPHLVLIAMGSLGMQYHVRYVLFCIVPYYVLAAKGITTIPIPAVRAVWVVEIILFSCFALRVNYFRPYKENYRDALLHVALLQQPGDCMVYFPNPNTDLPSREWTVYLSARTPPRIIAPERIGSDAGDCGRVWFVAWQVFPAETDQLNQIERKLPAFFTKTEEQHYFWVSTALFTRQSHPVGF